MLSGLLLACGNNETVKDTDQDLPNIVFLLIDDLGISSLPMYQPSPTDNSVATYSKSATNVLQNVPFDSINEYAIPHLYAFAQDARMYTRMYSTALCAPSRGALITGRYPFRNGIVNPAFADTLAAPFYANNLVENVAQTVHTGYLDTRQVGYPAVLRAMGYQTSFAGKWNLRFGVQMDQLDGRYQGDSATYLTGPAYLQAEHLQAMGFDYSLDSVALVGNTIDYYPPQLGGKTDTAGQYLPNNIFKWMADQLKAREKGTPQYLHYCFGLLHDPFNAAYKEGEYGYAPPPADAPNDSPGQVWADKIQKVDQFVGEFIAKIDSIDEANGTETIIIIAGDNGTENTYYNDFNGSLISGGKSTLHNRGSRVPFMVRWKGVVEPGIDTTLIDFTDIYPTLVELVNGQEALDDLIKERNQGILPSYVGGLHYPPTDTDYILDGQSFLNEMTGGSIGDSIPARNAIYTQIHSQGFIANEQYMITINSTNKATSGYLQLNDNTMLDEQIYRTNLIDSIAGKVGPNPTEEGTTEYQNFESLKSFYYQLFPLAPRND